MKKLICLLVYLLPIAGHAQNITTFAGNTTTTDNGDGGSATMAGLQDAIDLVADHDRNIYVLEYNRIRKITPEGTISTHKIINTASGERMVMTMDNAGNIFFATSDHIYKLTTSGTIQVVAGGGGSMISGIPATAAYVEMPGGICVDAAGNIYFSQRYICRVSKVSPDGIITTFAGADWCSGTAADGGPATGATIQEPAGITTDKAGNLYIVEGGKRRIRKVDASGIITTIAGNGSSVYPGDGFPATATGLGTIYHIAFDPWGNLYVSSPYAVRKIDTNGIVTSAAGIYSVPGFLGDGGPATDALLDNINGIATDKCGNLYIADRNNHRIRKVVIDAVCSPVLVPDVSQGIENVVLGPNPASHELTIKSSSQKITDVSVSTMYGKIVFHDAFNTEKVSIDIAFPAQWDPKLGIHVT